MATYDAFFGEPSIDPSIWSNKITFQFFNNAFLSVIDNVGDVYNLNIISVEKGTLWEAIPIIELNHFGNEEIIGYNLKADIIPLANPGIYKDTDNIFGLSTTWFDFLETIQNNSELNSFAIAFTNRIMSSATDYLMIKCKNKMKMNWKLLNNENRQFYKLTIKGFAANRSLIAGALTYT